MQSKHSFYYWPNLHVLRTLGSLLHSFFFLTSSMHCGLVVCVCGLHAFFFITVAMHVLNVQGLEGMMCTMHMHFNLLLAQRTMYVLQAPPSLVSHSFIISCFLFVHMFSRERGGNY